MIHYTHWLTSKYDRQKQNDCTQTPCVHKGLIENVIL